jgi:hypothetical protein
MLSRIMRLFLRVLKGLIRQKNSRLIVLNVIYALCVQD